MKFNIHDFRWTREPASFTVSDEKVEIVTKPHTDLWQRTYYHFRNDNAPVFQMETEEKFFTFTVKTAFDPDIWLAMDDMKNVLGSSGMNIGCAITDYDGNLCTIFSQKGNWNIGDPGYSYTRDEAPEKYEEFKARQDKGEILMLPVYMYDHSGQTISLGDFHDRFDSGVCGFAFVEKKRIFEEYPDTTEENWKEKAYKVIQAEIDIYDKYIRGENYAWLLEKAEETEHRRISDGDTWITTEWEFYDACGGYLGDPEESGLIDSAVGDRYDYIEEIKE